MKMKLNMLLAATTLALLGHDQGGTTTRFLASKPEPNPEPVKEPQPLAISLATIQAHERLLAPTPKPPAVATPLPPVEKTMSLWEQQAQLTRQQREQRQAAGLTGRRKQKKRY
jgi:hypothetical protein